MFSMESSLEPVVESNDEYEDSSSSSDSMGNESTKLLKSKTEASTRVPGYYLLNDYDEEEESFSNKESLLTEEDLEELNFSGDYIDDLEARETEVSHRLLKFSSDLEKQDDCCSEKYLSDIRSQTDEEEVNLLSSD